jgi:uncharacterized membrane protein SirB2
MTGSQWLGAGLLMLILVVALGFLTMRRPDNWWQ